MNKKKLTYNEIKKIDKESYTYKKIEVNGYEILIDEKLRPTKIYKMVLELLEKMDYVKENNINLNLNDYTILLFIKYFTDIPVPDELEKQIIVYEYLIDNGFLEKIMINFPKDELKKIVDLANNFKEGYKQLAIDPNFMNSLLQL